jgi:hypothetical protein
MKSFNPKEESIFQEMFNQNDKIAFHGTCSYYSKSIESKGFLKGKTIFDRKQINDLVSLLEKDVRFQCVNRVITTLFSEGKISDVIKSTFDNVKSIDYAFTMVSDFKTAKTFISDDFKCGQYLKNIKTVISDIKKLGFSDYPESIKETIDIIDNINNSNGVIYAIDISSLEIDNDGSRLHFNGDIEKIRLKGKIQIK